MHERHHYLRWISNEMVHLDRSRRWSGAMLEVRMAKMHRGGDDDMIEKVQ
jgi:hypothetical protein